MTLKHQISLSRLFAELAQEEFKGPIKLSSIFARLSEKGTGILALFISASYLIPAPMPGVSFLLALTLCFCSLMFLLKRKLLLPNFLGKYEIKKDLLQITFTKLSRFFLFFERFFKVRSEWMIYALGGRYFVSFVLFVSALVFMLPLPLGLNIPMALTAVLVTWGYLERDGRSVFLGALLLLLQVFCLIGFIDFFREVFGKI